MSYNFLKKVKDQVMVDCHELEVLIPDIYFTDGIAELLADKLKTIGIFKFRMKTSESAKFKYFIFNNPNSIYMKFQESYNSTETIKGVEDKYKVFKFLKDDVFIDNVNFVPSPKNIEAFVKLLHSGKLPKISYENIYHQYMEVQRMNNTYLGVPSSTIEGIISELARFDRDKSVPFRLALKNASVKDSDYTLINLKLLPQNISTFSGISFENINSAIASGVDRTRHNGKEPKTSMEETVFY